MSLFQFTKENKEVLLKRVKHNAFEKYKNLEAKAAEDMLEEMIYWEKKRVQKVEPFWRQSQKLRYWDQFQTSYLSADEDEKKRMLQGSINHYADQIVGNFSPAIFHVATKLIPSFLNLLMNALSFQKLFSLKHSLINENLMISGDIAHLKKLLNKGTLVLTPTHLSNLDSILLGTAFYYSGLPPMMYGAGLNLFRNKMMGFFMNRLGAYKVDRQRIHMLYKDVLKEYATTSLEMGFHNLFFPGGTRSRTGAVEKKLKLGLLGTTVSAYVRNLQNQKQNPNIYIVPVNLNAHLTLEAETLINDFLAITGQSRYIIENDEFSRPQRIFTYLKSHMNFNSKSFVHYGKPLDPFGNQVDEEGQSMDRHGRYIDIQRYVMKAGNVIQDSNRDQNYTDALSHQILDAFHRNNRVLSTNLVAFALYEMILDQNPAYDIYKLLRTYAYHRPISLAGLYQKLNGVIAQLKKLEHQGRIIYGKYLDAMDVQDIVNEALKIFGTYHKRNTVYRRGDQVFVGDLLLLYYYHNRLIGYNLEDMIRGKS